LTGRSCDKKEEKRKNKKYKVKNTKYKMTTSYFVLFILYFVLGNLTKKDLLHHAI